MDLQPYTSLLSLVDLRVAHKEEYEAAWQKFSTDEQITAICEKDGATYAAVARTTIAPPPPPSAPPTEPYADGRLGWHDWTIAPQWFQESTPWRAFCFKDPRAREGKIDYAYEKVTLQNFTISDWPTRRGRLSESLWKPLRSLFHATEYAAKKLADINVDVPSDLFRPDINVCLLRLSGEEGPMEAHVYNVAAVQKQVLELRSFIAYQRSMYFLDHGYFRSPQRMRDYVGAWFKPSQREALLRLAYAGAPAYFQLLSPLPARRSWIVRSDFEHLPDVELETWLNARVVPPPPDTIEGDDVNLDLMMDTGDEFFEEKTEYNEAFGGRIRRESYSVSRAPASAASASPSHETQTLGGPPSEPDIEIDTRDYPDSDPEQTPAGRVVLPSEPYHPEYPDRDLLSLGPDVALLDAPRTLTDDQGNELVTAVPVREGLELLMFTITPFENSYAGHTARARWEDVDGPEYHHTAIGLFPLPPPSLLEGGEFGDITFVILWRRKKEEFVRQFETAPPSVWFWKSREQWKSWIRPKGPVQEMRKRFGRSPAESEFLAIDATFSYPSREEWDAELWETHTFLAMRDFERLIFRAHYGILHATPEARPLIWAVMRDRARRVWGFPSYYPRWNDDRTLDHRDDLVRKRHWTAFGRVLLDLSLTAVQTLRVRAALGGDVNGSLEEPSMAAALLDVYRDVWRSYFTERDPYTFFFRPFA